MHQAHSKHSELSQRILRTQVTGYYKELIVLFLSLSLSFWKELNPKMSQVIAQIHTSTLINFF